LLPGCILPQKDREKTEDTTCGILSGVNPIQKRLLDIAKLEDISTLRRVDLVKKVGCDYPSQITHHMEQLIKRGDLVNRGGRLTPALATDSGIIQIPVMGEADCGEATKFADGALINYLGVSSSLLQAKNEGSLYALVARGSSMNHAKVSGKEICDGDYIIVKKDTTYTPSNGDVIVSIIGGLANVKRFHRDATNSRVVLAPDSYSQDRYAPIFISENDDFTVEGEVVDVVKGAKL